MAGLMSCCKNEPIPDQRTLLYSFNYKQLFVFFPLICLSLLQTQVCAPSSTLLPLDRFKAKASVRLVLVGNPLIWVSCLCHVFGFTLSSDLLEHRTLVIHEQAAAVVVKLT